MRLPLLKSTRPALLALAVASLAPSANAEEAVGAGGPLLIQVDGRTAGTLKTFKAPSYEAQGEKKMMGQPKIGEATAVFNISQAGALLDWFAGVFEGGPAGSKVSVAIADQDYNIKRGIDMGMSVITGIEWPELKASDGKKHFEVTAKWQAQSLGFTEGGSVKAPEPASEVADWTSFTVSMPGLKTEWITSIGLPKITPKISKESHGKFRAAPAYDGYELSTIKIEIGAAGFKAGSDLATRILQDGAVTDGEFIDIAIDMKDASGLTTGTFLLSRCGLKKFDWAPKLEGGKEGNATATMEFMVEDFRYKVDHK